MVVGKIVREFALDCETIEPLGNGLINDTYLVVCREFRFVLRRINPSVFPRPHVVVENFTAISQALFFSPSPDSLWPRALPTLQGMLWVKDDDGAIWHGQEYIEKNDRPSPSEKLSNDHIIRSCGKTLSHFHRAMGEAVDINLQEPLPNFHHLPSYLALYDGVDTLSSTETIERECRQYIGDMRSNALHFSHLCDAGKIGKTVIHGDPKVDNFIFGKEGVGLIDMDTAYYGPAHIDIGDGLRSFCNPAGENASSGVHFDMDICKTFLDGYMPSMAGNFSATEKDAIYDALFAITYELGVRFFTDHLQGDHYFRVDARGDNLHRAQTQFSLCQDISAKKSDLLQLIRSYA